MSTSPYPLAILTLEMIDLGPQVGWLVRYAGIRKANTVALESEGRQQFATREDAQAFVASLAERAVR